MNFSMGHAFHMYHIQHPEDTRVKVSEDSIMTVLGFEVNFDWGCRDKVVISCGRPQYGYVDIQWIPEPNISRQYVRYYKN